jgi:hypothetical protein
LDIGELLLVIPAGNLLLLVIPAGNLLSLVIPAGNLLLLVIPAGNLLLLVNLRHKNEIRAAPHIVCGPAIGLAKVANNLPKLRTD